MSSLALLFMAPPQGGQSGGGGLMSTVVMFGLIIFVFYFLILRPQQKRAKDQKAMLEGVKKGDKVVTSSGIHGLVMGVDDTTILLQIADNTKVKFEKHSIATILKSAE